MSAYTLAPSVISEIGWTVDRFRAHLRGDRVGREYWLRKAAVLDRIALSENPDHGPNDPCDAADIATEAARHLMDLDGAPRTADPRAYVRQQYAVWAASRETRS
ncbi:hypothetical protein [Streptomyces sp. NPDC051561]|uniref:hypothetical protein n=1 Tax=Streptomyces sp. NPDC051561 TaxID=3365658 RepID=UPI00379C3D48